MDKLESVVFIAMDAYRNGHYLTAKNWAIGALKLANQQKQRRVAGYMLVLNRLATERLADV